MNIKLILSTMISKKLRFNELYACQNAKNTRLLSDSIPSLHHLLVELKVNSKRRGKKITIIYLEKWTINLFFSLRYLARIFSWFLVINYSFFKWLIEKLIFSSIIIVVVVVVVSERVREVKKFYIFLAF